MILFVINLTIIYDSFIIVWQSGSFLEQSSNSDCNYCKKYKMSLLKVRQTDFASKELRDDSDPEREDKEDIGHSHLVTVG